MSSVTPAEIVSGLNAADVIVLPDRPASGIYPFQGAIGRNFGMIRDYCRQATRTGEFANVSGNSIAICVRNTLRPLDISGTWVTSNGCHFVLPRLNETKRLRMQAEFRVPIYAHYADLRSNAFLLPEHLPANGDSDAGTRDVLPLHVVQVDSSLVLQIQIPHTAFDGHRILEIRFDRYFVPKESGLNNDTRRLSVEFLHAFLVSE